MRIVISALKGFAIETSDGPIGTVVDFLFDDSVWKVRWLVVECGSWLKSRRVLIHPSAISYMDLDDQRIEVPLTRSQVRESPTWLSDQPVSRQMENNLYDYYGWDPLWGGSGAIASPLMAPPYLGLSENADVEIRLRDSGDPHLRSYLEIVGYHIHAIDGGIGHIENFMLDDSDWSLEYFIVDTSNWWLGAHVLIAPSAVTEIEWSDRLVRLNVSREQVKTSPIWDPLVAFNSVYAQRLHRHYGWPGSTT
jgi:hypothetical protein